MTQSASPSVVPFVSRSAFGLAAWRASALLESARVTGTDIRSIVNAALAGDTTGGATMMRVDELHRVRALIDRLLETCDLVERGKP